jgi:hypothetical protein
MSEKSAWGKIVYDIYVFSTHLILSPFCPTSAELGKGGGREFLQTIALNSRKKRISKRFSPRRLNCLWDCLSSGERSIFLSFLQYIFLIALYYRSPFSIFLGPNSTRYARSHFRAQKGLDFRAHPFKRPSLWITPPSKSIRPAHINNRYINSCFFPNYFRGGGRGWEKIAIKNIICPQYHLLFYRVVSWESHGAFSSRDTVPSCRISSFLFKLISSCKRENLHRIQLIIFRIRSL